MGRVKKKPEPVFQNGMKPYWLCGLRFVWDKDHDSPSCVIGRTKDGDITVVLCIQLEYENFGLSPKGLPTRVSAELWDSANGLISDTEFLSSPIKAILALKKVIREEHHAAFLFDGLTLK